MLIASSVALSLGPAFGEAEISPSKGWGMFVGTRGDVRIDVTEPGVAVRIEVPREFLEGRLENDTSFLYSNITRDYYYYMVVDQARHYPYDPNAPYSIEIWNPPAYSPTCERIFLNFTPPRYVLMKDLRAPSVAGLYNFTVYIAKNVDPAGVPIFPKEPSKVLKVPVSMGKDPSSVYGYIVDEKIGSRIKAKGVVYAIEVDTGAMAKAYVNSSTGFFKITGLAEGTYRIEASAGYFPETGYAYALTKIATVRVYRNSTIYIGELPLLRGNVVSGNVVYVDTRDLSTEIRPLESPYLKALGFKGLNYTVELYDEEKRIVASNVYESSNAPREPFRLLVRNGTKHVGYPPVGTEYAGFGPGRYTLRVWVFGFLQRYVPWPEPPLSISGYGLEYSTNVQLIYGGMINGTIRFFNNQTKALETPRQGERATFGTASGKAYGGNVLIEVYDGEGVLRGLTLLNRTYPNGTVTYADEAAIKFYVLGFSEFYNKTYSGAWREGSYPGPSPWDRGLAEGTYYIRVWVRGYVQAKIPTVTLGLGGSATATVDMLRGGAFDVTVISMHSRPRTRLPQAEAPWRFLGLCPPPRLRVYFYGPTGVEEGFAETVLAIGTPGVAETRATLNFSGHNWSIDDIAYRGRIPTALAEGEYSIKAYTYGYVQTREITAYLPSSQLQAIAMELLIGCGVNGTATLMANGAFSELTENAFVEVDVLSGGALAAVDVVNASKGTGTVAFSTYGFLGEGHFFYVSPDGARWRDYGLDVGNYSVYAPEFGFDWRYVQESSVYANLFDLGVTVGVHFAVARIGKIYGAIFGETYMGNYIPLVWASVSAGDRVSYSLDGDYVIHVPEGEYDVAYACPGYETKVIHVPVGGSFAIHMDVYLRQASSPAPPMSIKVEAAEGPFLYVLSARLQGFDGAVFVWSSDGGSFNSTVGRTVAWAPPGGEGGRYRVKAVAVLGGEVLSSASVELEVGGIPELPNPGLIFSLCFLLALGSLKFLSLGRHIKSREINLAMAFVLINAEIGSEDELVKELRKIPNVKEAHLVYGVYDIVARVEAETMDKLKEIVTWKIRRLDKVRSTLTMIVMEG